MYCKKCWLLVSLVNIYSLFTIYESGSLQTFNISNITLQIVYVYVNMQYTWALLFKTLSAVKGQKLVVQREKRKKLFSEISYVLVKITSKHVTKHCTQRR